jgi:KaiC/GvpD/RAD55 family RecA-like ATPase
MQDELFPTRKGKHVRPEDSVNEVLSTAASVGWDLRPHITERKPTVLEVINAQLRQYEDEMEETTDEDKKNGLTWRIIALHQLVDKLSEHGLI